MPIKHSEIMSNAAERIQRTEAYAEKVRKMFAATVNDILALNKSLPKLDEGTMYSFDDESMKKQKEVERLLRRLHSAVVMAVKQGITLEWEQANQECDKLVSSAFGKAVLSSAMFKAWTERNKSAMMQFINRSENGLNLSDRVWKSVRQLRDEMEVALTIGIGEGESAASMSRKVRQYLNDPDLMFRRFRYKNDKGEWQLKWKKRIKDEETGKYKWIDYDKKSYQDEWTGKGYYKSSAQNAMRVTRTETNIAYRRADHERWSQMDFVLGQRVQLSHNHPKKDICDKLQGDYPKEFVFDGWHPQCFCYVTPILVDESEMKKSADAFLKGKKYTPQGKQITEYPEAFKDWVKEHAEDIKNAREAGKEPYFIKNNAKVIDNILNPKKQLTTLEKAKIRHDARTAEQRQEIIDRWEARKKDPMHIAAMRHAARTPEQINDIKKRWEARNNVTKKLSLIKTEYKTLDEINETFKKINVILPKDEKWFEHGDLELTPTNKSGVNGFTYMDGRISLKQIRIDYVKSALSKIGKNNAKEITFEEADAMATFWHEITHNRNVIGIRGIFLKTKQRRYMELANEFIARHSLSEFYGKLGVKDIPFPEFQNNRASTGYNAMVTNYDFIIDILKLDRNKVYSTVRKYLFTERYDTQVEGLKQGLIDGGIHYLTKDKKGNFKPLSKSDLSGLLRMIESCRDGYDFSTHTRSTKEQYLTIWLKDHDILPK